jgi:hypothetical protein
MSEIRPTRFVPAIGRALETDVEVPVMPAGGARTRT